MTMKALEHLRVLDLGAYLAGPLCGTLFAEFGAEVIKVEPVGGEDARGFGSRVTPDSTLVFLSENRNKKSITLNLKHPSGIDILRRLVAISDVVIENFRPGVMERMGLGYDEIAALNQQAVMVRISAFGQTGPYRGQVGFARIAHAFSGLAILSGEPGRVPVTPGSTSLADYTSGLFAAFGAMVALQARGRTGKGQCVDMALYESVFRMLG
jgi:Predicted acyl-CoA transferases/carnitine dehydratase